MEPLKLHLTTNPCTVFPIIFFSNQGGAHKMTSTTPKPQSNWDLSHGTNVLVIIVIMPSRRDPPQIGPEPSGAACSMQSST